MNSVDFGGDFSQWATARQLSLAEGAKDVARFSLLDTLACIQSGVGMPQPGAVLAALTSTGDSGPATPVGGGPGLSLTGAALVNGARAHALDFDDYELSGSSHASGPIFGALLSLASAKELTIGAVCEAWTVGYEAVVILGAALGYGHYKKGWHTSLTLGPIGAAAAVSRALGLDAVQMSDAMAMASSSSAGSLRQAGFYAKAVHEGLAAQAGLQAAVLAQAGVTANSAAWDLPSGFIGLYGTSESPGFDVALRDKDWGDGTTRFPVIRKLWPSCAYTHRPIAVAIAVSARIGEGESIESIEYRMPRTFHAVAPYGQPENEAQARFSVPYCLAAALEQGRVEPRDFLPPGYSSQSRRDLVRRVELDLYDLPPDHSGDIGPSSPERLTVRLSTGRALQLESLAVPGGAAAPMTEAQLLAKTGACGLSSDQVRELLAADPGGILNRTALLSTLVAGAAL